MDPSSLFHDLKAALVRRDRHGVNRLVGQLLDANPPLGRQWRSLADVSRQNGALDHARSAIARYAAGNASLSFEHAAFLAGIGDAEAAQALLATIPENTPDPASRAHFAGTLALEQGRIDEAVSLFAHAIRHRPLSGPSWLSLAEASRGRPAVDWTSPILAAEKAFAAAPPAERAPFLFALGGAFDALGEQDRAFAAFSAGGALVRAARRYDPRVDEAAARAALGYRPCDASGDGGRTGSIFVFGPPRSGTTLVEQILSAHSDTVATGETPTLDIVLRDVGGLDTATVAAAFARRPAAAWADDYRALMQQRVSSRGRTVDKTLNTTRYAGLVAAMMPDAALFWVRRDPVDTAWSCFRTYFASGVPWSFDLRDIAHHLRLEDTLLTHWRDVLGQRLMVVDYDALTRSPEREISAMMRHAGLAPEPGVFSPERVDRAVRTASVRQVRQPINRRAVGVATPYRRHLLPFLDAYFA